MFHNTGQTEFWLNQIFLESRQLEKIQVSSSCLLVSFRTDKILKKIKRAWFAWIWDPIRRHAKRFLFWRSISGRKTPSNIDICVWFVLWFCKIVVFNILPQKVHAPISWFFLLFRFKMPNYVPIRWTVHTVSTLLLKICQFRRQIFSKPH